VAVIAVAVITSGPGEGTRAASTKGSVTAAGPQLSAPLTQGSLVPDFSAPGLMGGRVSWSDYRGSPTVLAVWAPWCPHCQVELPVLGRVALDFPSVHVVSVVTAVGLHPGPTPEGFMSQHGLTFPVAVDDSSGAIARSLGIDGFPTVYYVDGSGRVTTVAVGEVTEQTMRAAFQTTLG
jgi:peroxiredoxin